MNRLKLHLVFTGIFAVLFLGLLAQKTAPVSLYPSNKAPLVSKKIFPLPLGSI